MLELPTPYNKYPKIGPLTILESAAGYYVGRLYFYNAEEYQPYNRVSTYMSDEATARKALADNTYVEIFIEM